MLPQEQGARLDWLLAQRHGHISRARFQGLIAQGHVSIDGVPVTEGRRKVKTGALIDVQVPPPVAAAPAARAFDLVVVYEDDDLLVLDKPAGLVVHPGAGHVDDTLVNALLAHCGASLSGIGGVLRPGIVHRLDKDTSGLMVVAKNDLAHQHLSDQFRSHGRDGRLERAYLALAWGIPERRTGRIAANLARAPNNRRKIAVSRATLAREAITHYEVLENLEVASLVKLTLETGRTHQIRVHLAHIGHAVLGDPVYGSGFRSSYSKLDARALATLKALDRQALHAAVLGFEHPRSGEALRFESIPPDDFQALLLALQEKIPVLDKTRAR